MPKPCGINELVARIRDTSIHNGARRVINYDSEISQALMAFGIMPNHNGYHYLVLAVRARLAEPDALCGITKILYPEIAKKFGSNPQSVERCIRETIGHAWKNADSEARRKYFGNYFQQLSKRPTNSRFISFIAEFIINKCGCGGNENVNTN